MIQFQSETRLPCPARMRTINHVNRWRNGVIVSESQLAERDRSRNSFAGGRNVKNQAIEVAAGVRKAPPLLDQELGKGVTADFC